MGEVINKNKYLDFDGLKKYDELIKNYIELGNDTISESVASTVASIIDGAPESFDTLKEIAAWIADNDHASDVSNLLIDVAALKSIDHTAYISADEKLEVLLKEYVDNKVVAKQDIISDLAEIRSGASLGSTALQIVPEEYVTEDELTNMDYTTTTQVAGIINDSIIIATDSDIDNMFK